ncbi:alcohol dehydrogenase catalytic domain-containing protein [Streptomyces sp. NPDC052610]|uniref:alcohol dehydrogenase catalytic domain-containing protein n=1 Tax=Streptomyces sp. NPDC052610 TaxID=3154952 RepID=UPI00344446E3
MRAVVLSYLATPVEVADGGLADPHTGEAGVRVTAADVCRSEAPRMREDGEVPTPLVSGHGGSGVVTAAEPGVTGLTESDRVVLSRDLTAVGQAAGGPFVCP